MVKEERILIMEVLSMPRNMSVAMTIPQVKNKTKTVTRRLGWWFLRPGDTVCLAEKAMGLNIGEKIKKICLVRIVSTRKESLDKITQEDCAKEGFPDLQPWGFIDMFCAAMRCSAYDVVNRIEFEYL